MVLRSSLDIHVARRSSLDIGSIRWTSAMRLKETILDADMARDDEDDDRLLVEDVRAVDFVVAEDDFFREERLGRRRSLPFAREALWSSTLL